VRGVVAPLIAFYYLADLPFNIIGWICAGLIVIGTSLLVPEVKAGKHARKGAVLVEEVAE
jgi:hypothetical protein